MKKYQELLEAAKEGRISWKEFWDWFNRNIAIKGTGPIVQKMIEEKWRSWDEAKKRKGWWRRCGVLSAGVQ